MARDPFAGASSGTDPLAWVGFGLGLVFLVAMFGSAVVGPLRLTMYAILLYIFLVNADKLAPALARLSAALSVAPPSSSGRVRGGSY